MKKKRILPAFVMLALILVSLNLVLADDNLNNLTKSYTCLREKIAEKPAGYSSLTNEEKVFSLLALSSNVTEQLLLQSSILSSVQSNGCLSADVGTSGSCSLKTTGMGFLALAITGGDTSQLESWLNSVTNVDSNTEWYLEIDSGIASCRIYSGNDNKGTIIIDKDKKISGSLSGCFSYNFGGPFDGYWLKIDPSCYSENITTICNETFVTSLIYKKSDSNVYYIPDTAKSASANSPTIEKVNAFCFGTCNDYEGSLWAATALKQKSIDVEKFKPYLYTSAQSNQAFLPSAFLFKISDSNTKEYYKNELLNKKDPLGKWWQPSSEKPNERDYYTSLAVWVLGKDTTDASKARDYLIKERLQTSANGCLSDSIRDTAFALFAVSGSGPVPVIPVNITITLPNQTNVLDTAYPTVNVRINTAGSAKDCTYKIDNGNSQNLSLSSGTTIWTGSTNISTITYFSQHSIIVYCNNIAGQEKTASKEFNISIVSMNISIKEPNSNSVIKTETTSVKAELNAESRDCNFSFDSESKRYTMTETDPAIHSWLGQGTITVNGFPDQGKHKVTVFCIDALGKEITKQEEFGVDIKEPEQPTNGSLSISITNPGDTGDYSLSSLLKYVNLTATSAAVVSSCVYSLDGGNDLSMTPINESNPVKWYAPFNVTFNAAFEGNHNITASCTDASGNSAQKTIHFNFNTTSPTQQSCTGKGYYCLSISDCFTKTESGEKLEGFSCPYSATTKICCSENIPTSTSRTCSEKGGVVCEYNQECDGTSILDATDTDGNICCAGSCRDVRVITSCTSKSGVCRSSCNRDETLSSSYFCDSGDCCIKSSSPKSTNYWWVWVLLILIILIALGIVFREKIRETYYKIIKRGGKGSAGQGQQGRPPFGPGPGMPPAGMGMPRRIIPGTNRPGMMPMRPNMPSARPFPKDKELNETLAKLKNMSK